jgi:ribosomal protein S18 acetylase RimI-like enzyme
VTTPHPALPRIFNNQTAWLTTIAANDRAIWRESGITACVCPGHLHLLIPGEAGVPCAAIDAALTWLKQSGISSLLIWTDRDNPDLDAALTPRGAGDSWNPRWMQRDLTIPLPAFPLPAGIVIERAAIMDLPALANARDIPYVNPEELRTVLSPEHTGDMWVFVARIEATQVPVGHVTLFLPQDDSRQAGLYNAGVRPDWQHRGIGSALTASACQSARDAGANEISLNATPAGERAYRRVGFEVIGDGRTWFMRFPQE